MSYGGEFPLLKAGDLEKDEEETNSSFIQSLQKENQRLKEENGFLKHCLYLTKQNADLKTANILANILSLLDGKLASPWDRISISQDEDNKDPNIAPKVPQFPVQEVPSIAVDPQTSFRPIVPMRNPQMNENPYEKEKSRDKVPPDTHSFNHHHSLRVPQQTQHFKGSSADAKTTSDSQGPNPSQISRTAKAIEAMTSPISDILTEDDTWESMVQNVYKKSVQSADARAVNPESSQLYSSARHPQSEGSRTQQPQSEGYGTQGYDSCVSKDNVGSPLATSTPIVKKKASKSVDGTIVIGRPIDKILGIEPHVSEYQMEKFEKIGKNKRIVGEIAFQLDRRILEHVFSWSTKGSTPNLSRKRRYYGYSIANIGQMIRKEATKENGELNSKKELELRYRFDYVIRTLKKFGYNLELHGNFSQDMVNKFGLMNGPPSDKMAREFGLDDPIVLRLILNEILKNKDELRNEMVLLDCLCLLSYDDKKPLFMW